MYSAQLRDTMTNNSTMNSNNHLSDEHIIEAAGKCRVVIRDGKVVEVGEGEIKDCPLAKRFAMPVEEIRPDAVAKNIEMRIQTFGMCTPDRELYSDDAFVGFGASEIISSSLGDQSNALIDVAVIACDGAGTVIITDPRMVQGIGGRMSGLVKTVPYTSVIERILAGGGYVLDPDTARMNAVDGVDLALKKGFTKPVVTVVFGSDAKEIKKICPDAVVIGVHSTGLSEAEATALASHADLVTACASKTIREICGQKALMQAGTGVPVFALTKKGKEILIRRLIDISRQLIVTNATLPVQERGPTPLI
jgi:putative methanogenesis marker protein 8